MILDASALLAFLHSEPGADQVRMVLVTAQASTVNWAEVLQKSLRHQVDITNLQEVFTEIGVPDHTSASSRSIMDSAWLR